MNNTSIQKWAIPKKTTIRDNALKKWFPQAKHQVSHTLPSNFRGGRQQAINKLHAVHGRTYGNTRNFLNGDITYLSPYLRHGCINLKETVDFVREQFGQTATKLLNEFAWREYWRTVWYAHGNAILHDMRAPKVALDFNALPDDIHAASTGLPCMDSFITQLATIGYLHNHARMWLSAYIVHWRRTDWQKGAQWMHNQLIDGDYASNHLSWQWVSSTFSHKPYFFNQDNLAKYTHNEHCVSCKAQCPFKDSYANLEQQLFKPTQQLARPYRPISLDQTASSLGHQTIVWIHDEILNSEHHLLQLPHEKVFIFDTDFYQDWSINRLQFIADCLTEMSNVTVWIGQTNAVLQHLKTQHIITQDTPNQQLKQLVAGYPVTWQPEKKVCAAILKPEEITSFSKFWKVASPHFIGVTNKK